MQLSILFYPFLIFMSEIIVLFLRRDNTDKSWGFVLQGGSDQGLPIFIHKLMRQSIGHKAGLDPGDVILRINGQTLLGMTNEEVKAIILRAGNEMEMRVKKRGFNLATYNETIQSIHNEEFHGDHNHKSHNNVDNNQDEVKVIETPLWKNGSPKYRNVQSRTYKLLEELLPNDECSGSIFDHDNSDRKRYLQTSEASILKTFGEK